MPDRLLYICDAKRKIADGKCTGESCKWLHRNEKDFKDICMCERTKDPKYAKNKYDRKNFEFVYRQPQGDIDIYSERNSEGEYI